jgi:hypothetical protein
LGARWTAQRQGGFNASDNNTGRDGPMRCEVVAIVTELLLGQIVYTNSSWNV